MLQHSAVCQGSSGCVTSIPPRRLPSRIRDPSIPLNRGVDELPIEEARSSRTQLRYCAFMRIAIVCEQCYKAVVSVHSAVLTSVSLLRW